MSDEQPPQTSVPQQEILSEPNAYDIEKNKIFAVLAYLGILFLIPLLFAKNSPFARFHTNQGFILFLSWIVLGMIGWIPLVGWLVAFLGSIVLFVFAIMGIIHVLQGKMTKLPLLGQLLC